MALVKAFSGAISGMFADQWLDFVTVPDGLPPTTAVARGVMRGTDSGSGSNTKHSAAIISNGSKIVVPQGFGLITMADGAVTSLVTQPGGYIWNFADQESQSLFTNDLVSPTIETSWQRFKFGGRPVAEHLALFVDLKEIPGNRFGTQSQVYWDDSYLNTQVGAICKGTYTLRIVDPILFVTNLVGAKYLRPESPVLDLAQPDSPITEQLFTELVGSLSGALSMYANDPQRAGRMNQIQADSVGFAQSLSAAVENNYHWTSRFGLIILSAAISAIEYDGDSASLLSDVKKADALSGSRGGSFMRQSAARGIQSAGENGGDSLAMFGVGANIAGGFAALNQQDSPDALEQLRKAKKMLEEKLITQEDYDALKTKLLNL